MTRRFVAVLVTLAVPLIALVAPSIDAVTAPSKTAAYAYDAGANSSTLSGEPTVHRARDDTSSNDPATSATDDLSSSPAAVVAAETAGGAAETGLSAADQSALDYATTSSKLDHIFAAKHNFDPLVQQFGSREAVVQQFLSGLKGLTPASGTFEEQIIVGGQKVIVRGAVVNGVTKIGTAFTP